MMKKRGLSVLLATAMMTGLLAGCGSKEETATTTAAPAGTETTKAEAGSSEAADPAGKKYDGVELTYWSMWTNTEPQGKALQEATQRLFGRNRCKDQIRMEGS